MVNTTDYAQGNPKVPVIELVLATWKGSALPAMLSFQFWDLFFLGNNICSLVNSWLSSEHRKVKPIVKEKYYQNITRYYLNYIDVEQKEKHQVFFPRCSQNLRTNDNNCFQVTMSQ